ncbi:transcriptional regulator, IclR family [Pseudonocardia ammonioxydans]|uniref:Transcriptional regulator, IclR family n=1 Tax=Pseudonocardia ammonioxydans TaxID=260086 RepID=A0A1I5FWX2_PSUAM|nr:IclR family transcriptional regulator [Pseudonocardia ammonioxydans]SFO28274.1 transcriptional regulator, IclR family [Pseudonocardia ammonioxydans]
MPIAPSVAARSMIGRVSLIMGAFQLGESGLGITEISRRSGLAKATVSRIVHELVEHGFLEPCGREFRVGLRFFELGEQASRPHELRRLALASMSDLRRATGQTVHLAVLDGTEVVYVVKLRSRDAPPLGSRVGGRLPTHATAVGKALLAFADPATVNRVVAGGLTRLGPRTITDPAALHRELERIRREGVAYETEESGPTVLCAAAPVQHRPRGQVIAGLSVSTRVGHADVASLGLAVRTAALALGRQAALLPALASEEWGRIG